ncbi:MAG TPA: DUF1217 domain-containing protein [Acetobacteraceae bacterium]|jgi:hypothetical protein|nr:DUF1217 domain-containing protein [Acetobacteraceae bacterium]
MGTSITSGIDYAALITPLSSSGSSEAGSLLDTLYGYSTSSTATSDTNPVAALEQAEQNETQDITTTAAEPEVARAIKTFTAAVQTATSPAQLLSNPTVMQVLLTANGLADQVPYTALAQQTLLSNPDDPNSLVNQLTDSSWLPVVQTYNFATQGLSVIQNPSVIQTIANGYAEYTWLSSLDQITPGLSSALAFRSQASSVTSVDQILGSATLFDVVTGALGIPEQIVYQPLSAQEQAISSRLNIADLQNPKFVQNLIEQYLVAQQASATASNTTPSLSALAVQAQGIVA